MAYVDRFIFRFNSVSGKAVRIAIADNDYTGAAVERRLGGSPQLRCELSGNIHGMSLEIPAECKVDDEFAVLYTSDPTRFAVRLEVDSVVVWRGFVTPELYAAPWIDPPYDVQITATDGLGELKMLEWPAIGSRTLGEILETVLGATGLALPVRMISTAANDLATAADLLTGTTVNLDHMAGKSYYDVLDGLLGSLHCTISQRGGAWLLVRETDVTALTSGEQVSDTSGGTYEVKPFGSSSTHDCWPVGRLTTEIVPAKSTVEVECPNHLESLIPDPDMELNLWQTNGSWTGEDGGYYTLDLGEYISQTSSVANATRDSDPGFRIKVSSRNTTPFDVGIMRLTVMATGRDPRSGSDTTLYLKEVTTQGRTQMEWVAEESHFDDGLGLPKTLDHQDCKEFVTDIFRLPTGFNPIKTITIRVSSGRNTVCVHSVNIECMSVYDRAVTRLLMDNGARGDESYSPLFADSFAGNKGNFLLSNSPKGVTGTLVGTWSSDSIPSVPYGEWLAKDMALSVATPRLRMSGRLFTVDNLPDLFYSNKGLSYITEEWSLDLIEDEADISLISLPAAALSTVSVSVIVEDKDGRQGAVSGGEIVSPKTGESVSSSGSIDWFVSESFEENGEIKYRLKLNTKYQGMYAEGWMSAGGLSETSGGGGASYLHELLDVNLPSQIGDGQALIWNTNLQKWTSGNVTIDTTAFERVANKVTSVSAASDNTQYPTAKAVYDIVNTMLSSAMRFQGVTTTALVDGSTTNPVVIDGESYTATMGDVVVRSDVGLEFLWTGAKWQQLGDESSYAKKTVTITGSGYLTGGGNLEANRTIDIAESIKEKIDNGATAFGYFTDGAANEAVKLQTARKIWGQDFDGTGNVDGLLIANLQAGAAGTAIQINDSISQGFSAIRFAVNNAYEATIQYLKNVNDPLGQHVLSLDPVSSGDTPPSSAFVSLGLWTNPALWVDCTNYRVGVGTTSPAYRLDVAGDVRASGKVYIGTSGGYLEVVNVGTTASPVYALKSTLPFFSDSWVSAGGVSDTGGGGAASYLHELLDVNLPSQIGNGQALIWDANLQKWTSGDVTIDTTAFERVANKVTSVSAASDNTQYPTAKAVYDIVNTMLSSVLRSQGITTTPITNGSTTNPIIIEGKGSYTASEGDVVIRDDLGLEFMWTGGKWRQFGDESSYALKTVTITGSGYLTGGGNLEAAREIDITPEVKTKIDNGATAYASLGNYLPLTGGILSNNAIELLRLNNENASAEGVYQLFTQNGVGKAEVGYWNGAAYIQNNVSSPAGSISVGDDGVPRYNFTHTIWHAGNDGSGSGLDADLLDGWHGERYVSYNDDSLGDDVDFNAITYKRGSSIVIQPIHVPNYSGQTNYPYNGYGQMLTFGGQESLFPFRIAHINSRLYYQHAGYKESQTFDFSGGSAWKQIAFTSSNVASATKLETSRKLWGNDFNGTSDVKGSLEIFSTGGSYNEGIRIHPASNGWSGVIFASSDNTGPSETSANTWGLHNNEGRLILSKGGTSATPCLSNVNGNWGIDTYSPAYKLDVAGDIRATGAVNIKIPYSSSQNTYANYFKFINSEDTDVAHIIVTGQGHLGLYARRTIEFMADGTRRFIIGATSTQISEKKAGFYPEIDGTITLNSAGALSALGDGYNVGKSDKFIRATYSKIIYLTDSVYIYYDTVNNCIRTNAPIVSDSYISAGGVSTT